MFQKFKPVSIIGAGAFAEIILERILAKGVLKSSEISGTVRHKERGNELNKKYGIKVEFDNSEAAQHAKTIILCVRPQQIKEIADDLNLISLENKTIISVVAGLSIQSLKRLFNCQTIIRANPNPQLEAGFGYTAISFSTEADSKAQEWAKHILSCLGETACVDEYALNIFSSLSGITHVLYFFEALVEAGIYLGLSEEVSHKIVFKSIMGTMMLLEKGKGTPSQLLRKAFTPGGVGIEKVFVLGKGNFKTTIIESIKAAKEKTSSFDLG